MYPEALLCGSERFYGLGHPSGLRLYILFGPKILFHLRARSIWTHSRLDSDQKGVTRESKASSAKIAPKSIKIQSYYPKSSIFNLFGNVLGGFWATLCTFQGHLDRLDVFFGPTNAFKHIKFENIRNLTLITDLKVPLSCPLHSGWLKRLSHRCVQSCKTRGKGFTIRLRVEHSGGEESETSPSCRPLTGLDSKIAL